MDNLNNEKLLINVNGLKKMLGIGRNTALKMFNKQGIYKDFPSFKLANRYVILKDDLIKWLQEVRDNA